MLDAGDAFHQTISVYRLKVKDIAIRAGVSLTQTSEFKNKKRQLTDQNLLALINALPNDARQYFLSLTVEGVKSPGNPLSRRHPTPP